MFGVVPGLAQSVGGLFTTGTAWTSRASGATDYAGNGLWGGEMKSELASALCLAVFLGMAASGEGPSATGTTFPNRDINVSAPTESSSQNSAFIDPRAVRTTGPDEVLSATGRAPLGADFNAMLMVVTALICIVVLRRRLVVDADATSESRRRQPVSGQERELVHPDQTRTIR